MHAPLALHAIRPRRAHQVGIGHRDAGGVPRHVDLRHHANAARRGVSHHLPHLLAGVELAVAGLLLQFGVMLGGEAPALIVGQVPVEHVKLGRRHAVELAENVRQRQEMARRINKTPRHGKRGTSRISTSGRKVFCPSVCSSCSRVSMPRSAPKRVLAVSVAPCGVTASR